MKSTEHWMALIAAMVFVAMQHKEKPWLARIVIAGVSGALGYSLSPEVAQKITMLGPLGWTIVVTAFGYAALDVILSLISDRDAIRAAAMRWLGGRK